MVNQARKGRKFKVNMDQDFKAILTPTSTAEGYDGEFEELWARLLVTRPTPAIIGPVASTSDATNRSATTSMASTSAKANRHMRKVGTHIQRSSATNARKLQALLETPPPPPRRICGISKSRAAIPGAHTARKQCKRSPSFSVGPFLI